MKTNQNMVRKMGNYNVVQRTQDGYFDANALLYQWNETHDSKRRDMNEFLGSKSTEEFISTIYEKEKPKSENPDFGDFQIVIKGKKRGLKDGGSLPASVWMHPLLFIDFAMWINPRFKYDVLKFVYDEMIKYRHEAGDGYRALGAAISKIVPQDFMQTAMKKIGEALNWIIFNRHESGLRNQYGEEGKQRELSQLERKLTDLINEGFITSYEQVLNYLKRMYKEKHYPKIFAA